MHFLALRTIHFLGLLSVLVEAHGYLAEVIIDGKKYEGNVPNANPFPSAIQQIDTVEPNYGADNPSLPCGHGAKVASEVYDANPGSTIEFDWEGGDGSNWPHNIGPMLTYMASCGSTPCNQFDPKNARWFKIHQVAREKPGGDWVQQQLMDGKNDVVKIPSTLAPGNYLIRHEIIALHIATRMRGAEFYPSCAQLRISGSQTGKPDDSELVTFPGAYKDNDPGIFTPNIFNVDAPYTFPGPPIAKFIDAQPAPENPSSPQSPSAPAPSNSNKPTAGASSGRPQPTATNPSPTPNTPSTPKSFNQQCRLHRKPDPESQTVLSKRSTSHKIGRIMRGLDFREWSWLRK